MGKAPTCMRGISATFHRRCRNPVAPGSVLCESCRAEAIARLRREATYRFKVEPLHLPRKTGAQ